MPKVHPTIFKRRDFGELEILFQYVDEEPALVIRANRFLSTRRRAWVITLDSAWKYVDNVDSPHSGHSEYMVYASAKIQEMLGLGNDLNGRYRIAESIMDCLEDLINMPPFKESDKESAGDVTGRLIVGDEVIEIATALEGDTVNSTEGMRAVAPTVVELNRG